MAKIYAVVETIYDPNDDLYMDAGVTSLLELQFKDNLDSIEYYPEEPVIRFENKTVSLRIRAEESFINSLIDNPLYWVHYTSTHPKFKKDVEMSGRDIKEFKNWLVNSAGYSPQFVSTVTFRQNTRDEQVNFLYQGGVHPNFIRR